MKSDRLLSTLLLLQAHGRLTGRELARKLEVSLRTVHRDMDALSAAGVPVFAERGARGGWCLDEGWQTSVPGLEEAELRALLMAQPPRVLGDLRLAGAAERALGKLVASLPAPMRLQATSIRQRLFVDVEGWRGLSENLSMLPVVQDAVWRDRQLTIVYARPHAPAGRGPASRGSVSGEPAGSDRETGERLLDPLGLVVKNSAWYLVANTADGFRTFRVSRIAQATVGERACVRPPDFDLAAYWKSSTTAYQERLPRYHATLRVGPKTMGWLKTWRKTWLVGAASAPDAGGWVVQAIQFDCEDEACFVTLGLGGDVDVLEPDSLRLRVLADAEAIVARQPQVTAR